MKKTIKVFSCIPLLLLIPIFLDAYRKENYWVPAALIASVGGVRITNIFIQIAFGSALVWIVFECLRQGMFIAPIAAVAGLVVIEIGRVK